MDKTEASQRQAVDSRAAYTEITTHCKVPLQQHFKRKKTQLNKQKKKI